MRQYAHAEALDDGEYEGETSKKLRTSISDHESIYTRMKSLFGKANRALSGHSEDLQLEDQCERRGKYRMWMRTPARASAVQLVWSTEL